MVSALILAAHVAFLCPATDDSVSIYCETVHSLLAQRSGVVRLIIVNPTVTMSVTNVRSIAESLGTSVEVISALQSGTQTTSDLPSNLEFERPFVFMSEEEQRTRAKERGVGRWPDAGDLIVRLSAISLSEDHQEALVYAAFTCGSL